MRVISGSARGTVLHSIEDISTRPTLDRVKESLFNIIQNDIEDTTVLDLFAGSRDVMVPAEGQNDGHQDDDHRGVVDEGGNHERSQRDDQQGGQFPPLGYLVEQFGKVSY